MPAFTPVDACLCPLCGQPNQCAMELAKQSGQPVGICWCVNATFSADLLAKVAPEAKQRACICQSCVIQNGAPHE